MTSGKAEVCLNILPDPPALFAQAARRVAQLLQRTQQSGRPASLALAGGNTPLELYRQLASLPARLSPDWQQLHFFFGDERDVAADHPDSNYRMARETLFLPLNIAEAQIHRVRTELPPAEAVDDYLQQLKCLPRQSGWPCLDLVLLGMGNDGHIASLFPHSALLGEHRQGFTTAEVSHLGVRRYSLTLPVLNHAHRLLLLIAGEDKAATVRQALLPATTDEPLPVQQLDTTRLEWYLDSAAASQLANGTPL